MRDIKFRVWCQDKNEWEESFVVLLQEGIVSHVINSQLKIIRPERHIVEFYTGLKDSKGREIYEGDILKCPWNFNPEYFSYGYVVFYKGEFSLASGKEPEYPEICEYDLYDFNETPTRKYFWKEAEIIGNIHENPELLES